MLLEKLGMLMFKRFQGTFVLHLSVSFTKLALFS